MDEYRQGLISDLAGTTNQAGSSRSALGIEEDASLAPMAQAQSGKSLAELRWRQNKRRMKKIVDDMVGASGLVDENEIATYQSSLNKKLTDMSLKVLRTEADLKKQLAKRGHDRETRLAITNAAGNVLFGAAKGMAAGGGTPTQGAPGGVGSGGPGATAFPG